MSKVTESGAVNSRSAANRSTNAKRPANSINPDNGSHSSSTDDSDSRINARNISQIPKKYVTRSVAAHTFQQRHMDADKSYDADIESCISSQSDAEMPEEGTAAQSSHPQRPKRKRMKKKGEPQLPICHCLKNMQQTQACICSNNNSASSPQLCRLEIDDMSPVVADMSPAAELRPLGMGECNTLQDSACNFNDLSVGDSIALRRLRSDLSDRYQNMSSPMLTNSGRLLRKRRVDASNISTDTPAANKSAGDSGIFVSPNSPSHKRLRTTIGPSTSTPHLPQTNAKPVAASTHDYFGFEPNSPPSPVERFDALMYDDSTSVTASEALLPMDVSDNIDRNDNFLLPDEKIKLFPTVQQPKKRRKPVKKKTDFLMDELNAEFSEIENFQLTIE